MATQPKTWTQYQQHHGDASKDQLLARVAKEIGKRGTLHVLRKGVKDRGCKFELAYFRPSSGLNEELRSRSTGGTSSPWSASSSTREDHENSLDLALFLNGIPIFTAELKNPLTGQFVENAIKQYKHDRDPREPLFHFGRCLAHFAVDPDLVFTTAAAKARTRFLPSTAGRTAGRATRR